MFKPSEIILRVVINLNALERMIDIVIVAAGRNRVWLKPDWIDQA